MLFVFFCCYNILPQIWLLKNSANWLSFHSHGIKIWQTWVGFSLVTHGQIHGADSAVLFSGASKGRSVPMLIHVVDRIQFLVVIRLRTPLPCWLSPGDCSQLLDATHFPWLVASSSVFKASDDGLSPLMPQVFLACAPWHVPDTLSLIPAGKGSLFIGLCD